MKTYAPKTEVYRELLRACSEELRLLGYNDGTVQLNGVGELLQWLEARGQVDVAEVGREDLAAFLLHLNERPSRRGGGLSPFTIKGNLFCIGLFFDYCERHGLRGGSPLAGLPVPKLPTAKRYVPSREEVTKLYAAAGDDGRAVALLHLLYGCGLRRSEAERLNLGDVDYRSELLYVRTGKGRKRRVVPLAAAVAAGLKYYHKRERWRWINQDSKQAFLLNDRGWRMRGDTIAKQVRRLVTKARVNAKITPHALRHAVATHLLGGGMELERVRDFLGHEFLETTQIYTKVNLAKS